MSTSRIERGRKRGIRLEWATNAWNVLEVVITIGLGLKVHSLAMVAFGLDSLVEIFASTVVIWNLRDHRDDPDDRRIHRSLRLIAVAFWALGALLLLSSIRSLLLETRPESSPLGIAFMSLTGIAMLTLARFKAVIARDIGSETLAAEATMTTLDGCLSLGILSALVFNTTVGWWWADAGAAMIVAGVAIFDGVSHWSNSRPHEDDESGS